MKYILENVKKQENNTFKQVSMLVKDSKISYVNEQIGKLTHLRINTDGFYLATGAVMNDFSLGKETDYSQFKKRMNELIQKGCTTVVTYSEISYESQFTSCIKKTRHNMINSCIDYVIGIKVPSKIVRSSLIQKCKKENIAIILVEIDTYEQLQEIVWERVVEAMLNYRPVIIPLFRNNESDNKKLTFIEQQWKKLAQSKKIPTYYPFPRSHTKFEKNLCKLIGLYPQKGELLVGSDVDYNLYKDEETVNDFQPNVVVLRGKVLKADHTIQYYPGFGREVKIKVPGQFVPIEMASF